MERLVLESALVVKVRQHIFFVESPCFGGYHVLKITTSVEKKSTCAVLVSTAWHHNNLWDVLKVHIFDVFFLAWGILLPLVVSKNRACHFLITFKPKRDPPLPIFIMSFLVVIVCKFSYSKFLKLVQSKVHKVCSFRPLLPFWFR